MDVDVKFFARRLTIATMLGLFVIGLFSGQSYNLFEPKEAISAYPVSVVNWAQHQAWIQAVDLADRLKRWKEYFTELYRAGQGLISNPQQFFYQSFLQSERVLDDFMPKFYGSSPSVGVRGANISDWQSTLSSYRYSPPPINYSQNGTNSSEYKRWMETNATFVGGKPVEMSKIQNSGRYRNLTDEQKKLFEQDLKFVDASHQALAQMVISGGNAVMKAQDVIIKLNSSFNPQAIDTGNHTQAIKDTAKLLYYNTMVMAEVLKMQGEYSKNMANALAPFVDEQRKKVMVDYMGASLK